MSPEIRTINYGSVNCYLIKTDPYFVMIDTGLPTKRTSIEKELLNAGCQPGNLKLIVLTHGDYDHAGNAAYLREKYKSPIAMHTDDSERVERGNWNLGFKSKPDRFPLLFRIMGKLTALFTNSSNFDRFKPDIYIEDGRTLAEYNCEAQAWHLPGHTRGSLGILTVEGDLFCGDLMDNMRKPELEFFIDDMTAARASLEKLSNLNIKTVYPGHGKAFRMESFLKSNRK